MATFGHPLRRDWFAPSALLVAPQLLNKLLVHNGTAGRIVEVEAYEGRDDPASHAFRGPTARNAVMFGPPGHMYVYFTYGMHHCANVVCGPPGVASAVLIRALEPVAGIDEMVRRRGTTLAQLTSGPAKLCDALAIDRSHNGTDLVGGGDLALFDDGTEPPARPGNRPRVGISKAVVEPWRWWVPANPHVSQFRPGGKRRQRS